MISLCCVACPHTKDWGEFKGVYLQAFDWIGVCVCVCYISVPLQSSGCNQMGHWLHDVLKPPHTSHWGERLYSFHPVKHIWRHLLGLWRLESFKVGSFILAHMTVLQTLISTAETEKSGRHRSLFGITHKPSCCLWTFYYLCFLPVVPKVRIQHKTER